MVDSMVEDDAVQEIVNPNDKVEDLRRNFSNLELYNNRKPPPNHYTLAGYCLLDDPIEEDIWCDRRMPTAVPTPNRVTFIGGNGGAEIGWIGGGGGLGSGNDSGGDLISIIVILNNFPAVRITVTVSRHSAVGTLHEALKELLKAINRPFLFSPSQRLAVQLGDDNGDNHIPIIVVPSGFPIRIGVTVNRRSVNETLHEALQQLVTALDRRFEFCPIPHRAVLVGEYTFEKYGMTDGYKILAIPYAIPIRNRNVI